MKERDREMRHPRRNNRQGTPMVWLLYEDALLYRYGFGGESYKLGTPEATAWLNAPDNTRFIFSDDDLLARREPRIDGHHWHVQVQIGGRAHHFEIGRSEDITRERLDEVWMAVAEARARAKRQVGG